MNQPIPRSRHRRPRREARHGQLLVEMRTALQMLTALDKAERRKPLPEAFVLRLAALRERARRPLERAGAELAIAPIGAGPVAPGAALVIVLKLQMALEQATKSAAARPGAGASRAHVPKESEREL